MRFDALRQSQIDAAEAECGFTDEEREVLAMARRGKSVIATGIACGMSERTVKRRRAAIAKKLQDFV